MSSKKLFPLTLFSHAGYNVILSTYARVQEASFKVLCGQKYRLSKVKFGVDLLPYLQLKAGSAKHSLSILKCERLISMSYVSDANLTAELGSRYSLVIAVAKRAKQLKAGARQLVECKSNNPITIAMKEIEEGKLNLISFSEEEILAKQKLEKEQIEEVIAKPTARETAEQLLRVPESFEIEETEAAEEPIEAEAEPEIVALDAEILSEISDEALFPDAATGEGETPAETE